MNDNSQFPCPDCGVNMTRFISDVYFIWDCLKCNLWTTSFDSYRELDQKQRLLKREKPKGVSPILVDVRAKDFDDCLRKLKLLSFE